MDEKYTGASQDRRYHGENIEVTYNRKRCIHARECVKNLPAVFNTARRPWILPEAGEPDATARVIWLCPSGALHYYPKEQALVEPTPSINSVVLLENSYLQIRGNLKIIASNVDIQAETRVALCRCGASQNKPFCDNSHREKDFQTPLPETTADQHAAAAADDGLLLIEISPNGPIELCGNFEVRTESGELVTRGTQEWLCRCGNSQNKPFCDNSHKRVGFVAP